MRYGFFFFFNDTATTEIYTLSLHDALPIWRDARHRARPSVGRRARRDRRRHTGSGGTDRRARGRTDRKSTRLNSSHANISYAVFCLKKKKKTQKTQIYQREKHNRNYETPWH